MKLFKTISILVLLGLSCSPSLIKFNGINSDNLSNLTGKYYCKSQIIWICGKLYAVINFNENNEAEVNAYFECKASYFNLFKEKIKFNRGGKDNIVYRGNYCDILIIGNKLYLFINTNFKTELVEMKRGGIPDSLINYIDLNAEKWN